MAEKEPYYADHMTRNYYRYYDSPDGFDIGPKTLVATRYGLVAGFVMATFDALMYSRSVGLSSILKRYAFHCLPLGAMGATFALVSNGLLRIREEDDRLNYFLGGLACGPIAAVYLGSGHAVLMGGLALGTAAFIKKDAVDHRWTFFPQVQPHTHFNCHHDFTILKDPRDEWLKYCSKSTENKTADDKQQTAKPADDKKPCGKSTDEKKTKKCP